MCLAKVKLGGIHGYENEVNVMGIFGKCELREKTCLKARSSISEVVIAVIGSKENERPANPKFEISAVRLNGELNFSVYG